MNVFIFRKIKRELNYLTVSWSDYLNLRNLNPIDFSNHIKISKELCQHLLQHSPGTTKQNSSQMSRGKNKIFGSNKTECDILLENVIFLNIQHHLNIFLFLRTLSCVKE